MEDNEKMKREKAKNKRNNAEKLVHMLKLGVCKASLRTEISGEKQYIIDSMSEGEET